jgi:hypothetical protein
MHSFLLRPGRWIADGTFFDGAGHESKAGGYAEIKHERLKWTNSGKMTVQGDSPMSFENTYEIRPFDSGSDTTHWSSLNPGVGRLLGTFTVIGDAIVSLFESEDRKFRGQETFIRLSDQAYRAIGTFFDGDRKVSSWSVTLRQQ